MGNNNGTLDKCEKIGFKVIEVENGSPGAKAGLVPYFDFIINVNGYPLHTMTKDAIEYLVKRSENQTLQIEVYCNTKGSSRIVDITPSRDWPGDGLLGIVIRLEQYESDSTGELAKPQVDIDVSFDNIYHDIEATPERRASKGNNDGSIAKQRSSMFGRKSFSGSGSNGDSPKSLTTASSSSSSNYLSNPAYEEADFTNLETPSPKERRPSAAGKLLKVFSFSPKNGGTPSTEGTSDGAEDGNNGNRRVSFSPGSAEKRKSSSVFRKFSFTS